MVLVENKLKKNQKNWQIPKKVCGALQVVQNVSKNNQK